MTTSEHVATVLELLRSATLVFGNADEYRSLARTLQLLPSADESKSAADNSNTSTATTDDDDDDAAEARLLGDVARNIVARWCVAPPRPRLSSECTANARSDADALVVVTRGARSTLVHMRAGRRPRRVDEAPPRSDLSARRGQLHVVSCCAR